VVAAPACTAKRFSACTGLWVSSQQLQSDDSVAAVPLSVPGPSLAGENQKATDSVQGVRRDHGDHSDPAQTDTESAAGVKPVAQDSGR